MLCTLIFLHVPMVHPPQAETLPVKITSTIEWDFICEKLKSGYGDILLLVHCSTGHLFLSLQFLENDWNTWIDGVLK